MEKRQKRQWRALHPTPNCLQRANHWPPQLSVPSECTCLHPLTSTIVSCVSYTQRVPPPARHVALTNGAVATTGVRVKTAVAWEVRPYHFPFITTSSSRRDEGRRAGGKGRECVERKWWADELSVSSEGHCRGVTAARKYNGVHAIGVATG